jgi:hypothetical protein
MVGDSGDPSETCALMLKESKFGIRISLRAMQGRGENRGFDWIPSVASCSLEASSQHSRGSFGYNDENLRPSQDGASQAQGVGDG